MCEGGDGLWFCEFAMNYHAHGIVPRASENIFWLEISPPFPGLHYKSRSSSRPWDSGSSSSGSNYFEKEGLNPDDKWSKKKGDFGLYSCKGILSSKYQIFEQEPKGRKICYWTTLAWDCATSTGRGRPSGRGAGCVRSTTTYRGIFANGRRRRKSSGAS